MEITQALKSWNQDQPGKTGIIHQQDAVKRPVSDEDGILSKAVVKLIFYALLLTYRKQRSIEPRMIKFDHSGKQCLRIHERSVWLLLQLLILVILICGYYLELSTNTDNITSYNSTFWVLLIFPLFLSPYLLTLWRGITHRHNFVINGAERVIRGAAKVRVQFDEIASIELSATNATCEELRLSVILKTGDQLQLYEGAANKKIFELALQVATITGVNLRHLKIS